MKIKRYHQQIHFKCKDLELFYNMPVLSSDDVTLDLCPHIKGLMCSRSHELAPDKCRIERKCEILENKDELFQEHGICDIALQDLDDKMRNG